MRDEDVGARGEHACAQRIETSSGSFVRVDLVHGPHDPVSEGVGEP